MKDEATAYYSSLTGVFDQQLKEIQGKIKSVVTSVDTTLQDDDQSLTEWAIYKNYSTHSSQATAGGNTSC